MSKYKGIILAGGYGSRLYPVTLSVSKQLLPIYDKPMIYYPLSSLMSAGINEILIISDNKNIGSYKNLFGDGSSLGMNISYCIQESPNGIAESLILAEDFIGNDNIALILGDNIFYGNKLDEKFKKAMQSKFEATIFGIRVKNPSDFGVIEFYDSNIVSIIEKPENPKSNIAITGIYFYKNNAINYAKQLKPSSRGELEITDLNNIYLNKNQLNASIFQRGIAWLDTGSHESLLQAGQFIRTIEDRQGIKIGCIEEVAYRNNWITKDSLILLAKKYNKVEYGKYLLSLVKD